MSYTFFLVGGAIFAIYVWFTIWIIFNQNKKQREENYPKIADSIDMDGHGNYGRIPDKEVKYDYSRAGKAFMFDVKPKKKK